MLALGGFAPLLMEINYLTAYRNAELTIKILA